METTYQSGKASGREERRHRAERHQQKKNRRKAGRRQPYNDNTRLVDLVKPCAYERMEYLFRGLRSYLIDPTAARRSAYIEFDLERLQGHRADVYKVIAKFLFFSNVKGVLKVSVAAFARFLTDKKHSNFSISCKTLVNKLQEARMMLNLT